MRCFEGFFYMGWFSGTVSPNQKCYQCYEPANGFCVIVGKGEVFPLMFCADCGLKADAWFSTEGKIRKRSANDFKYIASIPGPLEKVAHRFRIDKRTLKKLREDQQKGK